MSFRHRFLGKSALFLSLFLMSLFSGFPDSVCAADQERAAPANITAKAVAQVRRGREELEQEGILPRRQQQQTQTPQDPFDEPLIGAEHPSLITQFVALSAMALMPFLIILLTAFIKVVVVLSLLRSALGAQQAPPNQVLNGVAFMLSLYIMFPTGVKMYDQAQGAIAAASREQEIEMVSKESAQYILLIASQAREPMRDFLRKNSSVKHHRMFYRTIYRTIPEDYRDTVGPTDFLILVPSYITSQLKDAFEIGVLIYIPFFVIDLVTANILLAMGMMMLSPVTISMPLKLFLLVMLDGWTLLIQGLITTFQN